MKLAVVYPDFRISLFNSVKKKKSEALKYKSENWLFACV